MLVGGVVGITVLAVTIIICSYSRCDGHLDDADVVGRYLSDESATEKVGKPVEIILNSDHSCDATNYPIFGVAGRLENAVTSRGTWRLVKSGYAVELDLTFVSYGVQIGIYTRLGKVRLESWIGDPDAGDVLHYYRQ